MAAPFAYCDVLSTGSYPRRTHAPQRSAHRPPLPPPSPSPLRLTHFPNTRRPHLISYKAEGGGTIGGGGASAEPHTLLYADPVSVPTLKRVGVTSSLETAPSALYYPNGSKRHTLRLEIQRQLASLSSESSSSRGGAATRLRRAARSGRRRGKSSTGQLSSTFEEKVGRSGRTVRRSPALLRSGCVVVCCIFTISLYDLPRAVRSHCRPLLGHASPCALPSPPPPPPRSLSLFPQV